MEAITLFYIPCPSAGEARRIARLLLAKRVVACANLVPIQSLYWWEGRIADEAETVLIAKTVAGRADAVEREVRAAHPYKVPCIARCEIRANADYMEWVKNEVEGNPRGEKDEG